jgi:hypothetical protein
MLGYRSGQTELSVKQLAYAYAGSNPAPSTRRKVIRHLCLVGFLLCMMEQDENATGVSDTEAGSTGSSADENR